MEEPVALYLEAHITIEPVFGDRLEFLKKIADAYNFRVADLLMKKREFDTPERSQYDTFLTGHATLKSDMEARMKDFIHDLKTFGYKVWRAKIEDTLMDTRSNDVWGLLS